MADTPTPATGESTPETTTAPATEELGDAGKLALQREREARRKAEQEAKANADAARRLAEIEESQKTETQKLNDRATAAEAKALAAELAALRLEVALDSAPEGMELGKVRKLADRLQGSTRDELEADAAELFAEFGPAPEPEDKAPLPAKPKESLRSGAKPAIPIGDDDALTGALKQKLGIR